MKYLAISILFCFFLFQEAFGHGAMYYPTPWWGTSECFPDEYPWTCLNGDALWKSVEDTGCTPRSEPLDHPGCLEKPRTGLDAWFTNFTFVEEKTIPDEFIDKEVGSTHWVTGGLHPWNSPGAAPTFGNGCGASGGNPFPKGCLGEDKIYGRCCAGEMDGWGCGGFVGGKTAISYYKDGFFQNGHMESTKWKRGTNQEVFWNSKAYHRGGYAYRLCKIEKVWDYTSGITEECFQKGHLKFAGNTTWNFELGGDFWHNHSDNFPDDMVPNPIVKTNVGTTPEGSEWAMINLPHHHNHWIFKDLVEIPEDIEPGLYVLSFRWDCQQSPQVWNSCSNIQILP